MTLTTTAQPFKDPAMHMLTIETAADMLATSPRTIRRYISSGDLPGYRLGPRQVRVKREDVAALLIPIPPLERVTDDPEAHHPPRPAV